MNKLTQPHDTQIFSAMVEILISSGLGEEDYGLRKPDKRYDQIRYEELATVMNQLGFYNRAGKPLNSNALKQVVHRVRQKEKLSTKEKLTADVPKIRKDILKKSLMDELRPDWKLFSDTGYTADILTDHNKTPCLVCGVTVKKKGKKLCSSDCVKVYQEHRGAPHDFKFPTIFHQMRYEETFLKVN